MPKKINTTNASTPIVDTNGVPTQAFFNLVELLSKLEVIDGDGNPNGSVNAEFKRYYFDTSGSKLYFKSTEYGDNTGWLVLN